MSRRALHGRPSTKALHLFVFTTRRSKTLGSLRGLVPRFTTSGLLMSEASARFPDPESIFGSGTEVGYGILFANTQLNRAKTSVWLLLSALVLFILTRRFSPVFLILWDRCFIGTNQVHGCRWEANVPFTSRAYQC